MMCLYSIDNLCWKWKWKWSKENHKMMVKEMAVLNRKSVYDIRWDVFCGVVLCSIIMPLDCWFDFAGCYTHSKRMYNNFLSRDIKFELW